MLGRSNMVCPPTDTADYADSDGAGMNNYQEWIAGPNPTNALSVLAMLSPCPRIIRRVWS